MMLNATQSRLDRDSCLRCARVCRDRGEVEAAAHFVWCARRYHDRLLAFIRRKAT